MSVPVATAIGFTVAMLAAVLLATTAGKGKSERSRARALGGPLTVLGAATVYLFVLIPVFANPGITLWPLLVLAVALILPPIVARQAGQVRARMAPESRVLLDSVAVIVAFALLVGQLATAGAALSLVGDVNRVLVTIAFGLCCAAYVMGSGRTGSIRTSRYSVATLVLAAIILAAGLFLGSPETLVAPLVPSTPLAPGAVAAVLLAVLALGCFDPNMRLAIGCAARPGRALWVGVILIAITVLCFGLGTMLFFGGAFQAPDLEIMTVFGVLPGVAVLVVLLVVTFILASNVDSLLTGGARALTESNGAAEAPAPQRDSAARKAVVVLAVVGVIAALLVPNPVLFLAVGAFVAAAGFGALLPAWRNPDVQTNPWPGFIVGVVAGIIVGTAFGGDDVVRLTWASAVVLAVVAAVAGLVSLAFGRRREEIPAST